MLHLILKTSSNTSDLNQTEPSEEVAILSMIAGIILTTLGVTGNLLTIIALLRQLLMNLALFLKIFYHILR